MRRGGAADLRKHDAEMEITLICGEDELPYQRPPLSKAYMSGEMSLDRLHLRPANGMRKTVSR
jgi:3-phenylpropionate/trans-cinnamate dioxygenase ferredoxin reductase subunit